MPTDLDKILHTPIVVRNTLVGRLGPRSARGWLQAKPEPKRLFFVILVTHLSVMPQSTYTTARLCIEALCTALFYNEISAHATNTFTSVQTHVPAVPLDDRSLLLRLSSLCFIVSLELVTYGPQFDGLRASVQPQAVRS